MTVGKRIRAARMRAGIRQIDLANACGVTQVVASAWENDRYLPRLDMAITICETLDMSLDELAGIDSGFSPERWDLICAMLRVLLRYKDSEG